MNLNYIKNELNRRDFARLDSRLNVISDVHHADYMYSISRKYQKEGDWALVTIPDYRVVRWASTIEELLKPIIIRLEVEETLS